MAAEENAPAIDWGTARIEDGELHVGLTGELPAGFAKRVEAVLARLGGDAEQRWGRVKVTKREIRVRDPQEGSEQDLRHELESAVLQASADLTQPEGGGEGEQSAEEQRDARMGEAFRAFGD